MWAEKGGWDCVPTADCAPFGLMPQEVLPVNVCALGDAIGSEKSAVQETMKYWGHNRKKRKKEN